MTIKCTVPPFKYLCIASSAFFCVATYANQYQEQAEDFLGKSDQIIVKYKTGGKKNGEASPLLVQAISTAGLAVRGSRSAALGVNVIQLDRTLSISELKQLSSNIKGLDSSVAYAEPDVRMQAAYTPNDSLYVTQWNLFESVGGINTPQAWDISRGAGVKVAVLDTGYRPHGDLASNIVGGYDFVSPLSNANDGNGRDADPTDPGDWCDGRPSSWHGTHVAGIVAGVTGNGVGIAGVAHQAKVVPVRVLGKCGGYTSDISDGIIWASGGSVPGVPANPNPARVLNLSLGGWGPCSTTYQNAINGARGRNSVVVVAAGNDNADVINKQPANCYGVIAVASTNRSGAKASYSNFGTLIDVSAPGGETAPTSSNGIQSTLNAGTTTPGSDTYAYYQGTSMATPQVAGVAALILALNPSTTPDQVEAKIKNSARPFPASCTQCGAGIVNALAAVQRAQTQELTVNIVPGTIYKSGQGEVMLSVTAVAQPNNAVGAVTYSWTKQGGTSLTSPTSSSTSVRAYLHACGGVDDSVSDVVRLTITDSLGRVASNQATAFFYSSHIPGRQCN